MNAKKEKKNIANQATRIVERQTKIVSYLPFSIIFRKGRPLAPALEASA
jgi:hypothetical protein